MKLLDLFCGRWGWSRAFAKRGWECVGVDLVYPQELPANAQFVKGDVLEIKQIRGMDSGECDYSPGESLHYASTPYNDYWLGQQFDFICASSPCEQFSVHGMKHFHPNPPYPKLGLQLFEHTRRICEESGVPYVMENVRAAQQFVGNAVHHCGPFYLWGTGVPPLMPRGIIKGMTREAFGFREFKGSPNWNRKHIDSLVKFGSKSKERKEATAANATIPPELANCVAAYAERIIEQKILENNTRQDSKLRVK